MKKIKIKYEDLLSKEDLEIAFKDALKNKNKNRYDILTFLFNKNENLDKLFNKLNDESYTPKPYFKFILRDTKPREICAPVFEDSIIQRLIYNKLYKPLVDKTIDTNVGCKVGKGLFQLKNDVQKELIKYNDELFYLHLDIRKYFYSMDHNIIKKELTSLIKDKKLIDLISKFFPTYKDQTIGIPIGNLVSQMIGMIFLNKMDHYIKRELKVKSYFRYVDDFLMIGLTKEQVHLYEKCIIKFLKNNYNIELSKIKFNKIKQGVNFCGYRVFKNKILARKRNIKKFINSLKVCKPETIISRIEYTRGTNSFNFFIKLLMKYIKKFNVYLPKKVLNKFKIYII